MELERISILSAEKNKKSNYSIDRVVNNCRMFDSVRLEGWVQGELIRQLTYKFCCSDRLPPPRTPFNFRLGAQSTGERLKNGKMKKSIFPLTS